jgi:hypothetical protein
MVSVAQGNDKAMIRSLTSYAYIACPPNIVEKLNHHSLIKNKKKGEET